MAHWKLTLMYDGSSFHGWQVQPGLPTIQGALRDALARLTGEAVLPQGSGRTDAGVHALAQVCSFTLHAPLPAANLQRALNRILPAAIRVLAAEEVAPGFHARLSARRKTYEYRLFTPCDFLPEPTAQQSSPPTQTRKLTTEPLETDKLKTGELKIGKRSTGQDRICSPFLAPFVWDVRWPLDLASMQHAATLICGTHDFTSFAAADPDRTTRQACTDLAKEGAGPGAVGIRSPVRTITDSHWGRRDDLLIYRVTGNGFLHHMVRNLVGTFVDVGRGSLPAGRIPAILATRDRAAAGPTAPALGLFLVRVDYTEATSQEPST